MHLPGLTRHADRPLARARPDGFAAWSHVDERCAGFFALGAAKASGRPVAVTCTSGTAAANLLPSVIEAREAGVPLIVLTADRPPELREVGAGQTIDQVKLYGDAVKWFFELDLPDAGVERLRFVRTLACRAYWTALEGRPGPVHLNLPLREPLVLGDPLPDREPGGGGRAGGAPFVAIESPARIAVTPRRHTFGKLVFVAGGLGSADAGLGRRLAAFSARAGVPLLADPLSNARCGEVAIVHYDLILRDAATAAALRPDVVCRIGELPTSKPLRAARRTRRGAAGRVRGTWGWNDPDGAARPGDPRAAARADRPDRGRRGRSGYGGVPRPLAGGGRPAVAPEMPTAGLADSGLSERLSRARSARGPADRGDAVRRRLDARPRPRNLVPPGLRPGDRVCSPTAVRTASTEPFRARSVSAACDQGPVVLLIGDVALAHDVGGLLAARRTALPLTIVLLNNDGGGIFHFLPVAGEDDAFEEHIATPTGLPFDQIAAAYGCGYERPADLDGLASRARTLARRAPDDDHRGPDRPGRKSRTAPRTGKGGTARDSAGEDRQQRPELDLGLGQLGGRIGVRHDPGARVTRAVRPRSSAQRRATRNSPSPVRSLQPTAPAYQPRSRPSSAGIIRCAISAGSPPTAGVG